MIPIVYNLRSLKVRRTTTLATALGVALVVFVLASAMMLSAGIKRTLGKSGRADTAIVMRKGADAELSSSIEEPSVALVLAAPGVRRDERGVGIGVGELVVVITIDKLGTDGVSNVQVRGVAEGSTKMRPELRVVAGRPAQLGTDEVMVGQRVAGRFKGLALGQSFELRKGRPVKVVGVFSTEGSAFESEVWVDLNTLRSAFGREALVSSVRVRLEGASKYDGFAAVVEQDKNLMLMSQREPEFYRKASESTADFASILGTVIAVFFSLGAMIGAMITMYASIASREREIGTLRALGFSRGSVLLSFLLEAILLSLLGGGLGLGASLLMSFVKISMMNFSTWSEVVFSFTPTPEILGTALLFAGVMGLFGGLLPAVRAARLSPLKAMRG